MRHEVAESPSVLVGFNSLRAHVCHMTAWISLWDEAAKYIFVECLWITPWLESNGVNKNQLSQTKYVIRL